MKGEPKVIPENCRIITFPDEVYGKVNGNEEVLTPNIKWYNFQGNQDVTIEINNTTYYRILVGPKILDPQYPDDGHLWASDFDNWGNIRIDVHLKLRDEYEGLSILNGKILEQHKILECVVKGMKAHTYNFHPDKTPGRTHKIFEYNENIIASFEIENGLIQTGIAYPNSSNAQKDKKMMDQ